MRRTAKVVIAGVCGVTLVAGGGMSADALTLASSMSVSASPSAWPSATSASTTPTVTAVPEPTFTVTVIPTATVPAPPTATPTKPEPPTEEEVAALFKLWSDALACGDVNRVADRYAPDAVLLPTLSNKVRRTRDEIVDYLKHFLESKPRGRIKNSTIKILGPTAAIDTGVYVFALTKDGRETQVKARYTFVYELVGREWLIVNHHSSAMPEPTE